MQFLNYYYLLILLLSSFCFESSCLDDAIDDKSTGELELVVVSGITVVVT